MNDQQNYEYGRLETLYKQLQKENAQLADETIAWMASSDRFAAKFANEKAECERLRKELKQYVPKTDRIDFYYMRSNHSFVALYGSLDEVIAKATEVMQAPGGGYGMLCRPTLVDEDGKEIRSVGIDVHARGREDLQYWADQCKMWKDVLRSDDSFFRIYLSINTDKVEYLKPVATRGFTLIEVLIVCVIIGLFAAMAVPAFVKIREQRPQLEYYQAWVKLHNRRDLSYEEWYVLYQRDALPQFVDPYTGRELERR